MHGSAGARERALTAVLVAPDRNLAEKFRSAAAEPKVFEILSEIKEYPSGATLEMRLRQIQPDVLLIDLATDFDSAAALIQAAAAVQPPIQAVGLHYRPDPEAVIRGFRAGASEFLAAPFDASAQREAAARIRRLKAPETGPQEEAGTLIAFAPAKPGSGASTLSTQAAFALKRLTGRRVLLVDLDVLGGSIAFQLKLRPTYSVLDAIERSSRLDPGTWSALVAPAGGIDVLAAPDSPLSEEIDASGLHDVLEYSRMMYDWVVIDTPSVFHPHSLLALSEADTALLVSTADLVSLHMARRAVGLLTQLGYGRDRFQMVVNRLERGAGLSVSDMEKIFGCSVLATLPEDLQPVHRTVTRVEPLGSDCELGKALEQMLKKVQGIAASAGRPKAAGTEGRAVAAEL
jgi:pilus assembly protein CpaE